MELEDNKKIYTLSIVFLGDFNPKIIQPSWLVYKKLILEKEGDDTKLEVIHNELTRFELEWLKVEVTKERFSLSTSKEAFFNPTFDLAVSIFSILKETPLHAVGINHQLHFTIENDKKYHEVGEKLMFLNKWKLFFKNPKLLNLELFEKIRHDGEPGYLRLNIQPSDQIAKNTVMLILNDHFGLKEGESKKTENILNRFKKKFDDSFKLAKLAQDNFNKIINS